MAVTVAAVLAAAWFGWSALRADGDESLTVARDRDAVVADVSAALTTLNTIDHRSAGEDVDAWLGVTAGTLGEDLRKDRQLQVDRARDTATVATARVRSAAVTELRGDTATVLAVLDVRLAARDEPARQRRSRLVVDATRSEEQWKVTDVQAAGR